MGQDIFVGVLCVIAVAAGVWCWIFDTKASRKNEKTENEAEKVD